jgi:hypothetical protein
MNAISRRLALAVGCAALIGIVFGGPSQAGAEDPKIVSIEEHWELAVGEPDPQLSAPQATMVMSPHDNLDGQYFIFTINHRSVPEFLPGGMQVQLWNGSNVDVESVDAAALNQNGDVVQWVQRLAVNDGTLTYEVVDGSSSSWGSFGGDELGFSVPTSLESLSGYRPAISLTESQVGYAGNRVQRLLLKKLVWQTDDGELHELHAPIDIDADLDPED